MATKLTLDKNTSLEAITKYFEDAGWGNQVRARDLGEGRIELYVRKNSFKQFFTDKLRPDFLVQRDYIAARNHITGILERTDRLAKDLPFLSKIKENLNNHSRSFRSGQMSFDIKNFVNPQVEKKNLQMILSNNWRVASGENSRNNGTSGTEWQQHIPTIIDAVKDPEEKKILQQNFNALNTILFGSPSSKSSLTIFDYLHAMDFSRAWLKASPELISDKDPQNNGSNENMKFVNLLTDFSKRIATWSAVDSIDYQGAKIDSSYADLVIVDPDFNQGFLDQITNNIDTKITFSKQRDESDISAFHLNDFSSTQRTGNTKRADILQVEYTGDSTFDSEKFDSLYKKIGGIIEEKMREKITQVIPDSNIGNSTASQLYVVRLPLLNPFKNKKLSQEEKSMMLTAFVTATVKWRRDYPNLRIKVQLPPTISELDIQRIHFKISKNGLGLV
ncbi:MAG: hypothetical protein LW731_04520 [Oxalobacteraceae bacterium]|nr:hypothetical protein [Oxalobacteraceae bacterium]